MSGTPEKSDVFYVGILPLTGKFFNTLPRKGGKTPDNSGILRGDRGNFSNAKIMLDILSLSAIITNALDVANKAGRSGLKCGRSLVEYARVLE
jgi:hypothetical protein